MIWDVSEEELSYKLREKVFEMYPHLQPPEEPKEVKRDPYFEIIGESNC